MSKSDVSIIDSAYAESPSKYQQWRILGSVAAAFLIAVVIAVAVVGAPIFNAFSGAMGGLNSGAAGNLVVPNVPDPSLGTADEAANSGASAGSTLTLSDEQKAEGYTLSPDGLVAWRYLNADELAALPCGGSELDFDNCAISHLYAIASSDCSYITVQWQGDTYPNSQRPAENGAPMRMVSWTSAGDTVSTISCDKS